MIYVCSDLHGFPLDKFRKTLSDIGFSESDTLYILGDVIDRNGDGGIAMLQWIMNNNNVEMIKGNHEAMLLECRDIIDNAGSFSFDSIIALDNYFINGGQITLNNLRKLKQRDKTEYENILNYIENLPLYKEIECSGKKYVLVHAGLGNFNRYRKLKNYSEEELLWERPKYTDSYFKTKTVVFGHTFTKYYGNEFTGKTLLRPSWINIDASTGNGLNPVILRLDDLKEFHVRQ